MSGPRRLRVPFHTGRAGSGPLIWAQLAIWKVIRWLPPDDYSLNLMADCEVPPGTPMSAVLDALRALAERHDSLHTLYDEEDGRPVQRVLPAGELDVVVHEADPDAGEQLRRRPFDSAADLPLRAAVITSGGAPATVVLVANHMAVDGWSFRIVREDLGHLLGGGELASPGEQPLERAAYESSASGQRRQAKALVYWARQMREIPLSMLEYDPPLPGTADLGWVRIESQAMTLAARVLAARCGMSVASVTLAATAFLLALYKGERDAAMRMIVSTRFRRENRRLVAAFNQNALFRVRVESESFEEFLRRAATAILHSYRHCEGDPEKLGAVVAEISGERGIVKEGYCFFNNVDYRSGGPERIDPADAAVEIKAVLDRTRVTGLDMSRLPMDANFFMYRQLLGAETVLTLYAGPRFLLPRTPADFLSDLELIVTRAASGPASVEEFRAEIELGRELR